MIIRISIQKISVFRLRKGCNNKKLFLFENHEMVGNSRNQCLKLNHKIARITNSEIRNCGDPLYLLFWFEPFFRKIFVYVFDKLKAPKFPFESFRPLINAQIDYSFIFFSVCNTNVSHNQTSHQQSPLHWFSWCMTCTQNSNHHSYC